MSLRDLPALKVGIKLLYEDSKMPTGAYDYPACMDLYAHSIEAYNEFMIQIGFGIALEIPEGYVGLVFPKSSISAKKYRLSNSVGVIDCDYRGEIMGRYDRLRGRVQHTDVYHKEGYRCSGDIYYKGDAAAQLMIIPKLNWTLDKREVLSDTVRGDKGFGSSIVK